LVLFLLLALGTTSPLWLHMTTAVPSDIGDPLLNAWTLAWDAHALLSKPQRLFDANIFFPLPNTLAYSEHLLATALMVMPLQIVSGQPLLAYNVALLLSFGLSGLGMYLLCLRWTGRRMVAFIAGLAYAFAPYRLASISHLQLLTVQWLPLSVLALEQLLVRVGRRGQEVVPTHQSRAETWKAATPFVLFIVLQALSSWYLAVFTASLLALYLVVWAAWHGWQRIRSALLWLLLCGVVATLMVVPAALPYLDVLPHLEATRPVEVVSLLGARFSDFLAAAPWLRLAGPVSGQFRERPSFTEEHMLYPGLMIVLLMLVSVGLLVYDLTTKKGRLTAYWRAVALMVILGVAFLLTIEGIYRELVHLFPSLRVIRAPARWMIVVTFALAGLISYGLTWLQGRTTRSLSSPQSAPPDSVVQIPQPSYSGRRSALIGYLLRHGLLVFIAIAMYAESFAVPLPLAHVGRIEEISPVYGALRRLILDAEEGARGAVLELPMYVAPAPEYPEARRMLASSLGWWELVNGYSGFTPARQMELGRRLASFPAAETLAALRDLGQLGVRYLIVHSAEAPFDHSRWRTAERYVAERNTTLMLLGDFGSDTLYLINPYGDALIEAPEQILDPFWRMRAPVPLGHTFDAEGVPVRLLAYKLDEPLSAMEDSPWARSMRLTLYWRSPQPLAESYTVFVHALDARGSLVGQADSPPLNNHYPTTSWRPHEIVQDGRLVPQAYALRLGLYNAATGQRLPAFAPDGKPLEGDSVLIVTGQLD